MLYCTPPAVSGSRNGTRSVSAVKSANQPSAVDVRLGSVASSTRALLAARSSAMRLSAFSDGRPSRHWSLNIGPSAPASPISPARAARSAAAFLRLACLSAGWAGGSVRVVPVFSAPSPVPPASPPSHPVGAVTLHATAISESLPPALWAGVAMCPPAITAARYQALPRECAQRVSGSTASAPSAASVLSLGSGAPPTSAPHLAEGGRGGGDVNGGMVRVLVGRWAGRTGSGGGVPGALPRLSRAPHARRASRSASSAPPMRIASASACQHASGTRARRTRHPAAAASRCTSPSSSGHWRVSRRACPRSVLICAAPLEAALMAAAAGSQSPTAITACGCSRVAARIASATAHIPNISAAGMDSDGSAFAPARARCAARSAAVAAAWPSAARAAVGHGSVTSHAVWAPRVSVVNA
eukprot:6179174-Pleurochrysis_carterae.AAC.1